MSHTSKGFSSENGGITAPIFFFLFTRAARDWRAGKLSKALELGSATDVSRRGKGRTMGSRLCAVLELQSSSKGRTSWELGILR